MGTKLTATLVACMLAWPALAAISEPAGLNPGLRASGGEEPAFMLTATANTWESSSDRSSVSGFVRATQAGGANNLPWVSMRALGIS